MGKTSGMWRIPDGKIGEMSIFMFRALRWLPPPVSIKDRSSGPGEQVRLCTGAYKMIEGIVHGPRMDSPECGIMWKTCTRVRWAQLHSLISVVNCCHSWCLCDPCVSCCQVITLQGLNWLESPRYPWIWVTLARCSHSVVILLS
jgi:hypothetical protein